MYVHNARVEPPPPQNEPVLGYAPGSAERKALKQGLHDLAHEELEIPMVIGGERARGRVEEHRMPHAHARVLSRFHNGGAAEVERAIAAAQAAWPSWSRTPWEARAAVFLRAAELLATRYRARINAATMLGQSKTAHQAEIDAACESVDFWRFNVHYASKLYHEQPLSPPGVWNALELRPLEGFVFCVTPFNFTSIGANLPTAPALMGNTVVWKPAPTAMTSSWVIMEVLEAAGLPPGVINLVSGHAPTIGQTALSHPALAGVHFTGSTGVFQWMWKTVGENIGRYRTYPRLVGETGGKDFIVAHPSADAEALVTAIVRGGYEYQGQKCSAASRLYIAKSVWQKIRGAARRDAARDQGRRPDGLLELHGRGHRPEGVRAPAGRDRRRARRREDARSSSAARSTTASAGSCARRWCRREDPRHQLMQDELFGPVVTMFVYDDAAYEETLRLVDTHVAVRADRRDLRDGARRRSRGRTTSCVTPPGTSTSTTSRPARWSASSPSAARARRARTTRPARR